MQPIKKAFCFVIKGEPETRTAQQKGVRVVHGHPHFFEKPVVSEAKARIKDELLRYVPDEPMTGSISLHISWFFGQKSRKKQGTPRTTRPDLDNLEKGFADCMTELGFWNDDSQIADLHLFKRWVHPDDARTEIAIFEYED